MLSQHLFCVVLFNRQRRFARWDLRLDQHQYLVWEIPQWVSSESNVSVNSKSTHPSIYLLIENVGDSFNCFSRNLKDCSPKPTLFCTFKPKIKKNYCLKSDGCLNFFRLQIENSGRTSQIHG